MEAISEAGGKFQSLSEPWADTTTHAGKMVMTIFARIAEFERDLIRERTVRGAKQPEREESDSVVLANSVSIRSSWPDDLF
jgi:DNA invertase Pin-like site-specific DNA recombinase